MLKLLAQADAKGVIFNTTTVEGKVAFARCLDLAQQSLSLTKYQQQQMATSLLRFDAKKKGKLGKKLADLFVRMHNDSLRYRSEDSFIPAEAQDPRLLMRKNQEIKVG